MKCKRAVRKPPARRYPQSLHTFDQWLVCARGGDCPVCEPDLYARDVIAAAKAEREKKEGERG